jgi:diguanylate cyclase (GGDEF)-like protein
VDSNDINGLEQLSRLLDRLRETGEAQAALRLVAERFDCHFVSSESLRLSDAMRTLETSHGVHLNGGEGPMGVQALIDRLCALSLHDGLTGVFNRRYFDNQIQVEIQRANRSLTPCGLLFGDIDRFKRVNDRYGHAGGDKVLKAVAGAFASAIQRGTDVAARYGGEEFVALLPATSAHGAVRTAERIRQKVAETEVALDERGTVAVTISIGAAIYFPRDTHSPSELVARADQQMYRAKQEGRNRVCCVPEDLDRIKPSGVSADERRALFP